MEAKPKTFLPKSVATLQIAGCLVTKNVKGDIRSAVHDKEMKKFLIKKYGWSESTFKDIDWISHAACLIRRPSVYVTAIMKLIHRWQPTNQKTACYSKDNKSDKCILCGSLETQHHYICCQEEYYKLARKNEWLGLKAKMKRWKVYDEIWFSMWIGMESWRNGRRDDHVELTEVDGRDDITMAIRSAYKKQSEIGWQHFHLGRLTTEWKRCMRLCYPDDDEKSDGRAAGCIRNLIENLWRMMLNVWKARNDAEHGTKLCHSARDIKIMHDIVDEIVYDKYQATACVEERWIFERSKEKRKQETVPKIATWLTLVSTIYVEPRNEIGENTNLGKRISTVLRRISIGSIFDE